MPENRRSQTRYAVSISVKMTVAGQAHDCLIANISLGGCQIIVDDRLAIGTRVELEFRIPTHEKTIVVGGATRWAGDESIGVQFDGLRAAEVWSLNKYFESLQA